MSNHALNVFTEQPPSSINNDQALVQSVKAREVAEVQAALTIAKACPRDEKRAMDRILNACQRPGLAEVAVYEYSRGGSRIAGPSINLAKAMAAAWGNLEFGIRELKQEDGVSTMQAYAWDMETNTREKREFQVKHERHSRRGITKLEDPRDVYETTANLGARRMRACILSLIPEDIIESAVEQCNQTMKASADTSVEGQGKLLKGFTELDISKEQIEGLIQRRLDSITPAQVVKLRNIYRSIKDGISTPSEWFETVKPKGDSKNEMKKPTGNNALNDLLEGEELLMDGPPVKTETGFPG